MYIGIILVTGMIELSIDNISGPGPWDLLTPLM